MSELNEIVAWTNTPVPNILRELPTHQQEQIVEWAREVVNQKTEGLDDLYNAIGMIVKYIPNFMVIPLMVEHIRPQIAAGVCLKMGADQAISYANDLPLEYFSKVSKHIDAVMMAEIIGKMRRNNAEKFIIHELQHHQNRMFEIAEHLERQGLEMVAKHATLPENSSDSASNPHQQIIDKIRAMQ